MKKMMKALFVSVLLLISVVSSEAAVAVVDIGLIQTNLANAKRDLVEQIAHGKRALEQIQHLRSQIRQIDDYLDRFGDPKSISIETFNEVVGFLKNVELAKSTDEILKGLKGDEIFDNSGPSPYSTVSSDIIVDGETVARRDSEVFAPEVAARRSFEHYNAVQTSVLSRRQELKVELERNLQQVRRATTASEVQKLDIITRNLEAQLALLDRELQFASTEALIQFQRNQVEAEIRNKVRVQEERAKLRVSQERNVQLYQFPTTPIPFKR